METAAYSLVSLDTLDWPLDLRIPSKRFRLFVAADLTDIATAAVASFARAALNSGMVYFCAWGPDSERFHDIVDEVVANEEMNRFPWPKRQDTLMTTWHDDETLLEALQFFTTCALPTEGLEADSRHWMAISVGNPEWAISIRNHLKSATLLA